MHQSSDHLAILDGLRKMHQSSDHLAILYKSSCKACMELAFSININKDVSPAKKRIFVSMLFTVSFIYNKKRQGPSTDPCGTPQVGCHAEEKPSLVTRCFLSER